MGTITTFYLSSFIGRKLYYYRGESIGFIKDLLVDSLVSEQEGSPGRPRIIGIKLKSGKEVRVIAFKSLSFSGKPGKITLGEEPEDIPAEIISKGHFIAEVILDKQIVDLNGRKLVRVNDVRMVTIANGTFAIAVDVGMEGLLRRIGIFTVIRDLMKLIHLNIPSKFIIWDDVQAIDPHRLNIKLSKTYSKLHTLHPSDLADIIEDLGGRSSATVFSALDEEKAADVMEELEPHAQVQIVENLPVEKVADVFDKMPADEVVDILGELGKEKAEELLEEMEKKSSQEVRELLEYSEDQVGSIMTKDILSFDQNTSIDDILKELRIKKPESSELYNLFVTEENNELLGKITLRDLVVHEPETLVKNIMQSDPICLLDEQKVDDVAEIVSKYNLLAIPVVNNEKVLKGMVVIDDIVEDLVTKRKTKKR